MHRIALSCLILISGALAACVPEHSSGDSLSSNNTPEFEADYAHDINNLTGQIMGDVFEVDPIVPSRPVMPNGGVVLAYHTQCPPQNFLGCGAFKQEVQEALEAWEFAGSIKFQEARTRTEADIKISFENANHKFDCDAGFTSRFSTLAHAYTKSCKKGEIHLNSDLRWTFTGRSITDRGQLQYDVRTVLIHEIGHLLGLEHEPTNERSVMHTAYNGSKRRISREDAQKVLINFNLN